MNIALFGGTFDPIHRGHVNVARAAVNAFALKQVRFIPADIPPHKQKSPITATRWSRWRWRARRT
jgi:nicotinate-nucleotide adenylyltransferase